MSSRRALGVLIRAELVGRRRATTILLLLVFTIAAAAIVAGLESQTRAEARWNAVFDEANGAHVTVYGADDETLRSIAAAPEVSDATHLYRAVERPLSIAEGQTSAMQVREVDANDMPAIARPLLRDGRWVADGADDEIVLERSFALEEGVATGDRVTIDPGGLDAPYTVVGTAIDLIDCFYPQCDPTPAWVDTTGFARVERDDTATLAFLRLGDPNTTDAFVGDLLRGYPGIGVADWVDTRADALSTSDFFGAFLSGFGLFVMIAAAVVVAGLMTTRVIARRRDIGLLKSVGFTPAQVTWTMLATHLVVGAVAVGLGWILGSWLSGPLQLRIGEVLEDQGGSFAIGHLLPTLLIVESIVLLATLAPSWRTGRLSTTAALAPVAPRSGRAARAVRLAGRAGAGPVGRVGVAAAISRPARTLFTALALVLAVVAVIVTVGMNRTVDKVMADPARAGDPYDIAIGPTVATADEVVAAIDDAPGVQTWFSSTAQLAAAGDSGAFLVRGLGGDVANAGFVIGEGRAIDGPNEAIAGYGLLDRLGVDVGDEVTIALNNDELTLTIVGWYSETEDSGEILQFPLETLRRVDPAAEDGDFLVKLAPEADAERSATALRAALGDRAVVVRNEPEDTSEIDAFRTAFLLVTVLVLVVALANLAATILLALRERFRDFGVLRSLGFTPRQILFLAGTAAALIGAAAALIGIPLGLTILRGLQDSIGGETGMGPGFGLEPSGLLLAALVPLAAGAAGTVGVLVARRPATATVSELVRFE